LHQLALSIIEQYGVRTAQRHTNKPQITAQNYRLDTDSMSGVQDS